MEEEAPAQAEAESKVSEPTTEEKPAEKPAEEEASVDKGMSKEDMLEVMTKGFQAAIKASQTERGLVSTEEDKLEKMQEILKKKSLGELAIMNGMFKAPDMYGRIN